MFAATPPFADSPPWVRALIGSAAMLGVVALLYLIPLVAKRVLQRLAPDPAMEARLVRLGATTPKRRRLLQRRLMKLQHSRQLMAGVVSVLPGLLIGAAGFAWVFWQLGGLLHRWPEPPDVLLRTPYSSYLIPAAAATFGTLFYLAAWLNGFVSPRGQLMSRLANYAIYRIRDDVLMHALGLSCFLVMLPLLLLTWGEVSLRVDADHVARSGFLQLGFDRRPLAELARVEVVPGEGQDILHLTFTDGEVWEIGHGGFPYPPGGAAALAVQIERLIADPTPSTACGSRGACPARRWPHVSGTFSCSGTGPQASQSWVNLGPRFCTFAWRSQRRQRLGVGVSLAQSRQRK